MQKANVRTPKYLIPVLNEDRIIFVEFIPRLIKCLIVYID